MSFKNLFKFLFVDELNELESCKDELEEARLNYNKLLKDYNSLAESYTENINKETIVEVPVIPRDFESKGEMQAWFNKNKIDQLKYIKQTHDCFACGTPIICKINDIIDIKTIDDIAIENSFDDVYVLNHEKEWVKVNWVKCKETDKALYQYTQNSSVTLTSDHKVKQNGKYIEVSECDEIDNIDIFDVLDSKNEIPEELAWLYGFFFSDGHCKPSSTGSSYNWKISNYNTDYLNKALDIANKYLYGNFEIVSYDSEKKGVPRGGVIPKETMYHLIVKFDSWGGGRFTFGQKFRQMFYSGKGDKKVPFEILHASNTVKEAFLDGVIAGDGDKNTYKPKEYMRITCGGEIGQFGLITLAKSIGYNIHIDRETRNANVLYLNFYKDVRNLNKKEIKRRYPTKQKWVWDINVDGGELIVSDYLVHNCDDFAIETQQAALADGYIVNLELDHTGSYYNNGEAHMLCGCRIGNMYYIIEPQNDRIVFETRLD